MNPPNCKLCESRHWTYDPHAVGSDKVRELGALVLRKTKPEVILGAGGRDFKMSPPDVPLNQPLNGRNKRTRGRPKKWASEAERKRAYRSRHGD